MLVITEKNKDDGGSFACISPPYSLHIYLVDFKEYIENRLMMKEMQLMRVENGAADEEVIKRLFAVVKELRFIYKQLFWKGTNGKS